MKHVLLRRPSASVQAGFGLVEIMVGVVIGMIAVLVIFQLYNVSEGFKRNTTAAGSAQQAGLYSAFALGMEIANAGAGVSVAGTDLQWCLPPAPITQNITDLASTFLPIPVLISDGGGNANSDSFVVNYSLASSLVTSAPFAAAPAGQTYPVQSPQGFHQNDLVVAIPSPNTPATCTASVITNNPSTTLDGNGVVQIVQTGLNGSLTQASLLFNMGPCNRVQKILYNVQNGVLQSTSLLNTSTANLATCGQPLAQAANPMVSNVLVMKAEYGINTSASPQGEVDTWVQATVGGGWDPATLFAANIKTINQIKAIRIGIIVQSEQFDKNLNGFTGGNYTNGDYNWVLFDCSSANKATCVGRLTGTVPATINPAGNWRFVKYETIIPMRNVIWNLAT
jgi:type IV pilus assembly protein PilW